MNTITQHQFNSLDGMTLEELAEILGTTKNALISEFGNPDTAVVGAAHRVSEYVTSGAITVEG